MLEAWENSMNWEFKMRTRGERERTEMGAGRWKTIFHMHGDDSLITIAFINFRLQQNHNNNNAWVCMGLLASAFLFPFFFSLHDARCKSDIHHQSANIFHLEFFHVYYFYCYFIKEKIQIKIPNAKCNKMNRLKAREKCTRSNERKAVCYLLVATGEAWEVPLWRNECMTCMKLWNFQWYALRVLWLIVSLHRRQIE